MSLTVLTPEAKEQLEYSLAVARGGKFEGSAAISYGRAAAIACGIGDAASKELLWNALLALAPNADPLDAIFPTIDQFVEGASKNIDKLTDFRPGAPSGFQKDLPESNAAGAYAFALDAMRRGNLAFTGGGELGPTQHWGVQALEKAGFPDAAKELNARLSQRSATAGHAR